MSPEPWEPGYKPPTAREAFARDAPLPRYALDTLDYINRKDAALQAAEARELEAQELLKVAYDQRAKAGLRVRALEAALAEMELHDDTGDPYDEGYMRAVREMQAVLKDSDSD